MKLSAEIWDNIYKFVIDSAYYVKYNVKRPGFDDPVCFIIGPPDRSTRRPPDGPPTTCVLSPPENPDGIPVEVQQEFERMKHPGRVSNYAIYPTTLPTYCVVRDRGKGNFELLNLSNTNSIVRQELAKLTWTRTSLFLHAVSTNLFSTRSKFWNSSSQIGRLFGLASKTFISTSTSTGVWGMILILDFWCQE